MKRTKFTWTLLVVGVVLALTVSSVFAENTLPPPDQSSESPVGEEGGISVDALPVPRSPSMNNLVYVKKPVFVFTRAQSATSYEVEVYNLLTSTVVGTFYVPTSSCDARYCRFTSPFKLKPFDWLGENGLYRWRVRAKIITWSEYSDYRGFNVLSPGFNATFDTWPAFTNWQVWNAGWTYNAATGTIQSEGWTDHWSELMHIYYFENDFEYTVRMKRKVNETNSNAILIYGYPTPIDTDGGFDDGVYFQYANDGKYGVWQNYNGSMTWLKDWTNTDAIKPYKWNVLKVVAQSPYIDLYLNDTYLGWVEVTMPVAGGYVGIGMSNGGPGEPLLVDYAQVSAYYLQTQTERDPAMKLGGEPIPATEEEVSGHQ